MTKNKDLLSEIPVIIFAGGLGTRLREETAYKPKPMVEIGEFPILWHIMKIYSSYGFRQFIICAGYKKEIIQDYFINFHSKNHTIEIYPDESSEPNVISRNNEKNWVIKIVDTGEDVNTGGRLKKVQNFIETDNFLCTYGDGLSNINIKNLYNYHLQFTTIATLAAVKPPSRFGVLQVDESNFITGFKEKPDGDTWINGGFFVFSKEIFEFLSSNSILEREPLEKVSQMGELKAYKHEQFWQPMDTYREFKLLNDLWSQGSAPWKVWN